VAVAGVGAAGAFTMVVGMAVKFRDALDKVSTAFQGMGKGAKFATAAMGALGVALTVGAALYINHKKAQQEAERQHQALATAIREEIDALAAEKDLLDELAAANGRYQTAVELAGDALENSGEISEDQAGSLGKLGLTYDDVTTKTMKGSLATKQWLADLIQAEVGSRDLAWELAEVALSQESLSRQQTEGSVALRDLIANNRPLVDTYMDLGHVVDLADTSLRDATVTALNATAAGDDHQRMLLGLAVAQQGSADNQSGLTLETASYVQVMEIATRVAEMRAREEEGLAIQIGAAETATGRHASRLQEDADAQADLTEITGGLNDALAEQPEILEAASDVIDEYTEAVDRIADSYQNQVDEINDWASSHRDALNSVTTDMLQVEVTADTTAEQFVASFSKRAEAVREFENKHAWLALAVQTQLVDTGVISQDTANQWLEDRQSEGEAGTTMVDGFLQNKDLLKGHLIEYEKASEEASDGMVGAYDHVAPGVEEKMKRADLWMRIALANQAVNARLKSEEVGDAIPAGVVAGIEGGQAAVNSAIRTLVDNAVAEAEAAIDSGSPSRRFRDEIGKPISAGIAEGIEGEADKIADSLTDGRAGVEGCAGVGGRRRHRRRRGGAG